MTLSVEKLSVYFENATRAAVDDVSFDLERGKITTLIGESGSGKSTIGLALMTLVRGGDVTGRLKLDGRDLLQNSQKDWQKIRGKDIAIVFQDPGSSLNPLHSIGRQIEEAIQVHNPRIKKRELRERVLELLGMVGLRGIGDKGPDYRVTKVSCNDGVGGGHAESDCRVAEVPGGDENVGNDMGTEVRNASASKSGFSTPARGECNWGYGITGDYGNKAGIGIEERLGDFPHQFSGGQKQRIMLAMAVANNPSVLILDEPTTALDPENKKKILKLVLDLKKRFNLAILFVTHDLDVVRGVSDEVLLLKGGKIIERSSRKEFFNKPKSDYGRRLVEIFERDAGTLGDGGSGDSGGEDLLAVRNLSVKYKKSGFFGEDGGFALKNISFTLKEGESLGIVGGSGAGKSTLAKALMGLVDFEGEVSWGDGVGSPCPGDEAWIAGQDDRRCRWPWGGVSGFLHKILHFFSKKGLTNQKKTRDLMQIVFQDPFSSLNPRFTVRDIIAEGLVIRGGRGLSTGDRLGVMRGGGKQNGTLSLLFDNSMSDEIEVRIDDILSKIGLDVSFKERYPHQLSGGQRQRVALARALVLENKVIVLDEPTSALDFASREELLILLIDLAKLIDFSYVVISHDMGVVNRLCDRVLRIEGGELVGS